MSDVLYVGLGGVKEDQVTIWNGVHVVEGKVQLGWYGGPVPPPFRLIFLHNTQSWSSTNWHHHTSS